jgi:hypothetical protein
MTRSEKLKEVLRSVAVGLSVESPQAAIEGSSMSLRLRIQEHAGMNWHLGASKTKFFEYAWLELIDVEGELLTGEGTKGYLLGTFKDPERLRFELVGLADRIVTGNNITGGLAAILIYRERSATYRLERLETEAHKIPEAKKDLAKAQSEAGWLKEMTDLALLENAPVNGRGVVEEVE